MSDKKEVLLAVIIPTLGERESLLEVIATIRSLAKRHVNLKVEVIVSFNPRSGQSQKVFLRGTDFPNEKFRIEVIRPETYQPSSEHHLLWCLRWFKQHRGESEGYAWPLTDNDPVIAAGFDALVDFLGRYEPDIFFVNNLWADTLGQPLPSPAFRVNRLVWHGNASLFFRSQGFEHATSNIGSLFLRGGFINDRLIAMFDATLSRSEGCAHAWWSFEAAMTTDRFYFVATPIVANKFNTHHFDHSSTWRQNAQRNGIATYHFWTVGYLRHLQYYVYQNILSYQDIRTSMLSEPQRTILPFLDDVLRRLLAQAKLALTKRCERLSADDIDIITKVFVGAYPLRAPLVKFLCKVLSRENGNVRERLKMYKLALKFRAVEVDQGVFSILFRNAFYGYYCYEHNLGFVAVLNKNLVHYAYRDVDPVDIYPNILYAASENLLLEKIEKARIDVDVNDMLNNFEYLTVALKEQIPPCLCLPRLQSFVFSRPEVIVRLVLAMAQPLRRIYIRTRNILAALR